MSESENHGDMPVRRKDSASTAAAAVRKQQHGHDSTEQKKDDSSVAASGTSRTSALDRVRSNTKKNMIKQPLRQPPAPPGPATKQAAQAQTKDNHGIQYAEVVERPKITEGYVLKANGQMTEYKWK